MRTSAQAKGVTPVPFVSVRQDELMFMLRKLLLNIGDLPAQTSHILFNYLVKPQIRRLSLLFSSFYFSLSPKLLIESSSPPPRR